MGNQFCHIEPNSTGADDGDALADRLVAQNGVDVTDNAWMIDAFDPRGSWGNAGCQNNFIICAGLEKVRIYPFSEFGVYAGDLDLALEVAKRFMKLFLARNSLCQIELATDPA